MFHRTFAGRATTSARSPLAILTLGALGVVYGDIGTSPLYAFREALAQTAQGGIDRSEVIGVLSLMLWALIIVVTLKYMLFLTRADNNGDGGVLSLMALGDRATHGTGPIVLVLGGIWLAEHSGRKLAARASA